MLENIHELQLASEIILGKIISVGVYTKADFIFISHVTTALQTVDAIKCAI